jgi:hypothetical protein
MHHPTHPHAPSHTPACTIPHARIHHPTHPHTPSHTPAYTIPHTRMHHPTHPHAPSHTPTRKLPAPHAPCGATGSSTPPTSRRNPPSRREPHRCWRCRPWRHFSTLRLTTIGLLVRLCVLGVPLSYLTPPPTPHPPPPTPHPPPPTPHPPHPTPHTPSPSPSTCSRPRPRTRRYCPPPPCV